jgi:hypothetical protein
MKMEGIVSTDHSGAGFPVPRIYRPSFQQRPAYAVLHCHWFWSSADIVNVLRPSAPGLMKSQLRPRVVEALAYALVADLLADLEGDHETERKSR